MHLFCGSFFTSGDSSSSLEDSFFTSRGSCSSLGGLIFTSSGSDLHIGSRGVGGVVPDYQSSE